MKNENKLFICACSLVISLVGYSIGFVTPNSAHSAVSFQQVKNVFSHVQNTAGYHVVLHYSKDPYANAWCDYRGITITQGMLNDLNTEAEVAAVLGHELGHFVKRDPVTGASVTKELRADMIGDYWCKKVYGPKKCLRFFYTMKSKYGEEGKDGIHPKWSTRIKHLQRR